MTGRQQADARRRMAGCAMAVAAAIGTTAMATAISAWPAPAVAADATAAFDIPTQDLNQALLSFADQAGWQVFYDARRVEGRRSSPLQGRYPADQALAILLAGTGLGWRFTGPEAVALDTLPETGATERLDPLTVEGSRFRERADGPVIGYVATRSASGTRTDTPLIETPQSVTVVTADEMTATKATTLSDALGYTASVVTMPSGFSRVADDITIRGFNVANGNTGMLRDGMKLQSNVYDGGQEPYGLERLEVLRGAASVLYGQLGPGGVVNAITKQPTRDPLHELSLDAGSNARRQIATDHGGALDDDGRWSYRLTALYRDSDTWIDHIQDDKLYIAPALRFDPDDDTRITLLASHQEIRSGFAAPLPTAGTVYPGPDGQFIPADTFLGEPDYDTFESTVDTIGYRIAHDLSPDLKLRHGLRYYRADVSWDYMQVGWSGSSFIRRASDREEHSTGLTADTSVEYTTSTGPLDHTLLGGVDIYRQLYDTDRYYGGFSLFDPNNPVYGTDPAVDFTTNRGSRTESDQLGIYLQDQVKIDDHWVVVLGGRYDWLRSDVTSASSGVTDASHENAFTGRAGLVYLFDNGLAPYASFSQSFSANAGTNADGAPLSPTTGEQIEIGLRYQLPDGNTMLSAAVYELVQDDVVNYVGSDVIQTGRVRSRGVEAEARTRIGALALIASYAYTDARITESAVAGETGQRRSGIPLHAFGLWGDYGLDGFGLRGVRIGGGARYVGAANLVNEDTGADVPSHTLYDAMVSFDLAELSPSLAGAELRFNARNLTDEDYVVCNAPDGCRYGDPRTMTGTISYRW